MDKKISSFVIPIGALMIIATCTLYFWNMYPKLLHPFNMAMTGAVLVCSGILLRRKKKSIF